MANPTQQQTLQQKRAAHAWGCIEKVSSNQKSYGLLVRGLPSLIQSDGLGQTLAFLKAKAGGKQDKEHMVVYNHITAWVQQELNVKGDFLEWLLGQSSTEYRRATVEVLAYLNWIKRFAEAKGWQDEGADR